VLPALTMLFFNRHQAKNIIRCSERMQQYGCSGTSPKFLFALLPRSAVAVFGFHVGLLLVSTRQTVLFVKATSFP
jgi:hypothetical protein